MLIKAGGYNVKNILMSGVLVLMLGLPFSLQAAQEKVSVPQMTSKEKPILLAKAQLCKRACDNDSKVVCKRHP